MQSIMLCCKRFRGQHTEENIAQYYEEVISTFNIVGKVTTVVTDNASNVVKASTQQMIMMMKPVLEMKMIVS